MNTSGRPGAQPRGVIIAVEAVFAKGTGKRIIVSLYPIPKAYTLYIDANGSITSTRGWMSTDIVCGR